MYICFKEKLLIIDSPRRVSPLSFSSVIVLSGCGYYKKNVNNSPLTISSHNGREELSLLDAF
jgi:hypothetical protein